MKIIYICSCLEPASDGVGDYTRRLACELIKQGHSSAVLSLNDKYISNEFNGIQHSENIDLPVLRLPANWSIKKRINHAKKYIDGFNPDWLSLQFVLFGFHPKGLPFNLDKYLFELGKNRKWHVMFHELWVGMDNESGIKFRFWGILQSLVIKKILYKIKPLVIHTQTKVYQIKLKQLGFDAAYLPVISNIPYFENSRLNKPLSLNGGKLYFVVFASIHHGAPIALFSKEAAKYAKDNNVTITLVFIGRNGNEKDRWIKTWEGEGMPVKIFGEREPEFISLVLQHCTLGINSTPMYQAEKSGAVAAILNHGLKVLCVSRPWTPSGFSNIGFPDGIIQYQEGNLKTVIDEPHRPSTSNNNVSRIVNILVNTLEDKGLKT